MTSHLRRKNTPGDARAQRLWNLTLSLNHNSNSFIQVNKITKHQFSQESVVKRFFWVKTKSSPLKAERKQQVQWSLCEALENIRVMFQKLNNFTQWKKTLTATGACLDFCGFVIQLPTDVLTAFSQTTICILVFKCNFAPIQTNTNE